MNIDIRTIIIILGITHLMQVLVFYHQYRVNKRYKGIGWWLLWSMSEVIGFGAFLFRGIPEILPLIVIIQNTMIIAGTVFLYIGIRKFFDKSNNIKALLPFLLVFMLGFLYSLFIVNDIQVRSWFISSILAIISLFTAYTLFVFKPKSITAAANFNAIIFLVHAGIFIYRTILIVGGTSVTNIFSRDLFNILPFFDALVVSLLWTFGLIIMLNQRLNVEINEAKEDLQLIFNTSPDAVLITRLNDGVIKDVNSGLLNLTGYSKEEVIGKSTLEINLFKDSRNRQEIVDLLNEKGSIDNFEINLLHKNGSSAFGLLSAKIIEIHSIPHILSATRDINERKLAEQQIKDKNEELQKLNAEKDKFFSIIAHDLRSPFNGFLGLTQLMAEELPTMTIDQLQKIAVSMRNSASKLFNLLENLLEWSRIQQGLIPFVPVNLELSQLIMDSTEIMLENANKKEINLSIDIPDNCNVFADKNMLQTIVRNLVSNAVKFTAKGGKINITVKSLSPDTIEVSINDTGIGMNKEFLENIFRIDTDTTRKGTEGESSTGLGLLLCKEFVEKNGGKLWAESEEGKGSIFYFTLQTVKN